MHKKTVCLMLVFGLMALGIAALPATAEEMSPYCQNRMRAEKARHEARIQEILRYEKQDPLTKQNEEDRLYRENLKRIEDQCLNKTNTKESSCKSLIDRENARHEEQLRYIFRNANQSPLLAEDEEDTRHRARLKEIRQNCSE